MKHRIRHRGGFRWEDLPVEAYKTGGADFRGATRQVLFGRGAGRVLVDPEVFDVAPFDLVHVPPRTWHCFRASPAERLGFLCLVDCERDRPERPGPQELERLRAEPEIAALLRT